MYALTSDAAIKAAAAVLLGRVNAPEQEIYSAARAALEAVADLSAQGPKDEPVAQLGGAPDDLRNLIKVVLADKSIEEISAICKEVVQLRDPALVSPSPAQEAGAEPVWAAGAKALAREALASLSEERDTPAPQPSGSVEALLQEASRFREYYVTEKDGRKNHLISRLIDALSAITAGKPDAPQGVTSGLTISRLQTAHIERQEEWCPDQKPDLSFRGNEMAGEVGEACNVIKKLERERHGWRGSRATREQLADELADVVHTAVLCAITADLDLEPAVVAKFNATSEKNGLATLLPAAPTAGGEDE